MIQHICFHAQATSSLRSYDYYAFGYQSGLFHQPPVSECFDELRTLISRKDYDTVVLIGHSQGGVIVKLFILKELLEGRGKDLKVDIVITLDTPHRGPKVWFYPLVFLGGVWKRIPLVGKFPLFRQLGELGRWSANLNQLRKNWNENYVPSNPCPPERKRRHISSYAIVGARPPFVPFKVVVPNRSAEGFEIDQLIELPEHRGVAWDVGHGVGAMWECRFRVEQILTEHDQDNWKRVERELASATSAQLPGVLADCLPDELPCEVQCWTRRVAEGFPRRPLRCLDVAQALRRFVEKRRANP